MPVPVPKADGRELALVVDGKALVELFRDHRGVPSASLAPS